MELKIKLCIIVILICAVFCADEEKDDENDDPFVPTHEWQVLRKGKKIPRGLHVRINLETGITEAKLLDEKQEKENGKTALAIAGQEEEGNLNSDSDTNVKMSKLKESLKNIENDYNVKNEELLKRIDKFKSYEELKKDLSELNLKPKADTEILKELIEKYVELAGVKIYEEDVDSILVILEDLEYLVHQYDNANEFVSLNGFRTIIYKNLNSTNKEIKRETLKLLGSSIQNNIKVKIYALETGTLDILLRLLALEDDLSLNHRAFFALSALLRGFPHAQLKFMKNAGISVFSTLFERKDLKLRLRMVTLISDLLHEEAAARNDLTNKDYISTIHQYDEIKLKELLVEQGYCQNVNDLLVHCITIDASDHDAIEKTLNALNIIADDCALKSTQKILDVLLNMRSLYEKLMNGQSDTDLLYFKTLFDLTNQLVKKFTKTIKFEL